MGVFVAGVPSSLAPRTPFFSRVLAPLPLSRLRLLRRLAVNEMMCLISRCIARIQELRLYVKRQHPSS